MTLDAQPPKRKCLARFHAGLWIAHPGGTRLITTLLSLIIGLMAAALFSEPGRAEASATVTVLQAKDSPSDGKRLALVIGNSEYRNVSFLKNPVNDAAAVAEKLQGLGYEVHLAKNLDRLSFNETIAAFLHGVEPGMEILIYYAGHGVELDGSNYLLPVDVPELASDQEYLLRTEGVSLSELLIGLQARSARVTLVILDACRDNPFVVPGAPAGTRSLGASRGLGRVDPPSGTFVIFSAGVGEEALDNLGPSDTDPNGLFTRKLLTLMGQQGLEIHSMVQQLRAQVRQAALTGAGQSQIPSYYDQLLGEFYFKPDAAKPEPVMPSEQSVPNQSMLPVQKPDAGHEIVIGPATPEAAAPAAQAPGSNPPTQAAGVASRGWEVEQRVWDEASKRNTVAHYEAYLQQFPNGAFADLARLNLKQIKKTPPVVAEVENDTSRSATAAETPAATADPDNEAGTELTESAIGLNRQEKIDLQERLLAIGYDLHDPDGTLGTMTRRAIGEWQQDNRLPPTTFLTRKQYVRLILDSDGSMKNYRAQRASEAKAKKQETATSQKTRKPAPKPIREQQRQATKPRPSANSKPASQHTPQRPGMCVNGEFWPSGIGHNPYSTEPCP
ncbi:caspase family protein [Mesorhizobium sp. URHB0026]